jgi:hypothetical protein
LEREANLAPRDPLDDARSRTDLLVALAPHVRAGHCTAGDAERMLATLPAA